MKIKNLVVDGDMIRVTVDGIPDDFVYFKDKFNSLVDLEKEITKKIVLVDEKVKVKKDNVDNLIKEFNLSKLADAPLEETMGVVKDA